MDDKIPNPYLVEVYKQACENARFYAGSRFTNLSSFLTYVSILVAATAFISSSQLSPNFTMLIGMLISALGFVVTFLFFALEVRHHFWWEHYEGQSVKSLEKKMGIGQNPQDANFSGKRKWIKKGIFGIQATQATYGIYIVSFVFFVAMFFVFLTK